MEEMEHFQLKKAFWLKVIGLFTFLAGFCHVPFPKCYTPIKRKTQQSFLLASSFCHADVFLPWDEFGSS